MREDCEGLDATVFVYLIRDPVTGTCKIGQSINPLVRMRSLAPPGRGLELVSMIATADPWWLERYMHETFSHCRVRGEWFRMSSEEISLFASVGAIDSESDIPAWAATMRDRNAANGFRWGQEDQFADVATSGERMPELSADGTPMPPKKRGRAAKPVGERKKIVTTALPPYLCQFVKRLGGDSVYRGLQILAERAALVLSEEQVAELKRAAVAEEMEEQHDQD